MKRGIILAAEAQRFNYQLNPDNMMDFKNYKNYLLYFYIKDFV